MTDRVAFLRAVRGVLNRRDEAPTVAPETGLSVGRNELFAEAARVRAEAARRAGPLLDALAESAAKNAWKVVRARTNEDAAEAVAAACRGAGAKSVVRSDQNVFTRSPVDRALAAAGVHVSVLGQAAGRGRTAGEAERGRLKAEAFAADAGITGADYAIAETGTIALHPRAGLSRLVSLAPPVHIAVVERGSVLPSLDELFVLERESLLRGELPSYMNLISGPSRTGDIEATIVQGIHGPLETHLVLVG
jgi:L-lactate dehydrogenase complex protein LldG